MTRIYSKLLICVAIAMTASLFGYSAAFADESKPVITNIDMSQAYSVQYKNRGFPVSSSNGYKEVAKANRAYANWEGNAVKISYKAPEDARNCYLERSADPNNGFARIYAESESDSFIDKSLPRGQKFYYRVVAECTDNNEVSNVVSILTSPGTLNVSKAQVKTPKGWKNKLVYTKKTKSLFKKSKSSTIRLSWKKRTDVDGYYVYRLARQFVPIKKLKAWQYPGSGIIIGGYVSTVSSKLCKRVKTLKANATSVTCKMSNKYVVKTPKYNYWYIVVPFIKQNGKVYIGDCNTAYGLDYDYGQHAPSIDVNSREFSIVCPFPLMK